jgi:hypothetical protein
MSGSPSLTSSLNFCEVDLLFVTSGSGFDMWVWNNMEEKFQFANLSISKWHYIYSQGLISADTNIRRFTWVFAEAYLVMKSEKSGLP